LETRVNIINQKYLKVGITIFFLIIILLYFFTASDYLNNDGDTIELLAAGYCNGVPHSPGYPAYIRIINLFINLLKGWFSVPRSAYIVNIALSVITLILLYSLIKKIVIKTLGILSVRNTIVILISILYLAISRTYWSQSINAEVYILHILTILALCCLFYNLETISYPKFVIAGIISGIGLANHTVFFFVFAALLIWLSLKLKIIKDLQILKKITIFLSITFAVFSIFYFDLLIRSKNKPALNLLAPQNINDIIDIITLKQYSDFLSSGQLFINAKLEFLKNNFISNEFDLLFLIFAIIGIFITIKKRIYNSSLLFYLFGIIFLSTMFIYRQISYEAIYSTTYVFFLPLYPFLTIFFTIGLIEALDKNKYAVKILIISVIIISLAGNAINNYVYNNLRKVNIFHLFAEDIVSETGDNAIIISDNETIVYLFWYLQIVEKKYMDITVLHLDLLNQDWYLPNDVRKLKRLEDYKTKFQNNVYLAPGNFRIPDFFEFNGLTFKHRENPKNISFEDYRVFDNLEGYSNSTNEHINSVLTYYANIYYFKGIYAQKQKLLDIADTMFKRAALLKKAAN